MIIRCISLAIPGLLTAGFFTAAAEMADDVFLHVIGGFIAMGTIGMLAIKLFDRLGESNTKLLHKATANLDDIKERVIRMETRLDAIEPHLAEANNRMSAIEKAQHYANVTHAEHKG